MEREPTTRTTYDVAILGSGLAGAMLGAILARNGARVVLIDRGAHPRSATGESTTPATAVALRTLAERYGVPEIKSLVSFENTTRVLGPTHGLRRHQGFLLHRAGRPQSPGEVTQFSTPPGVQYEGSHLYRQDADAQMFYVAVRYGVTPRQNVTVADIAVDDDGVTVTGGGGEEWRARCVVDASGPASPLADKLGLREEPARFRHHSRTLWTHMVGVPRTDDLLRRRPEDTPPVPWYEGTVHHLFERGWFWVIGFDNHPASRNGLCSVGLTLDSRRYPRPADRGPEEEFFHHASRFPDIARQFAGARPVREWATVERSQYSSRQCAGDRWFLLGEAAGFVDPLFSQSLTDTADTLNALARRLLDGVADGDFSHRRLAYPERLQQRLFDHHDALVNAAFTAWDDHDLWSAVFRVWAFGTNIGATHRYNALAAFLGDGDDRHFTALENAPHPGLPWPVHDGFRVLWDEMVAQCEAYELGKASAREAADALHLQLRKADFVPKHFGFAERWQRFIHPGPRSVARMTRWLLTESDTTLRETVLRHNAATVRSRVRGRRPF